MPRAGLAALLVLILAMDGAAAGAKRPPGATITWTPQTPHSGEMVTFTATAPPASAVAWDLDGDGRFESTGPTATGRWTSPGMRTVTARLTEPSGKSSTVAGNVEILNAPPVAAFGWAPAGEQIAFSSQSSDPDGGTLELKLAWDLDGDGAFDDATGPAAATSLAPGDHVVRLQATDAHGATSVAEQVVHIADPASTTAPSAPLLSPFPVVRLRGRITPRGVRVTLLSVSGPRGALVSVRCLGRGCPPGRISRAVPVHGPRIISVSRVRGLLHPGARIEIRVTESGRTGKYTRFLIRHHGEPLRRDGCLTPDGTTARCG